MSQANSGLEPEPRCWDCGAVNDAGSSECWLCQRRDWRRNPGPGWDESSQAHITPRGPIASISRLMVLTAVIAVLIGLFVVAPGLAIVLLVGALPAVAVTETKANHRRQRGEAMSGIERFLWIVGLMIAIPFALIAAIMAPLIVVVSSVGRGADPAAAIFIVLVVVFLGFFIIAILLARSRRMEREQNER
jgi:MFS family permease